MKVLFFDFTINFGGAPQGSLYLMSRLKDKGIDAAVVDVYGKSQEYRERALLYELDYFVLHPNTKNVSIGFQDKHWLRVLAVFKQSKDFAIILIKLFHLIKRTEPSFFIVNNEKSLFFLKLLKPFFKYKIILYFRSEGLQSQLTPRFVNSLKDHTDHIIAHSKKAIFNLKNANIPSEKLTFVPNCIELDRFLTPKLSNDLPKKINFRLILAAARPVQEKGHHIAIQAVYELKRKNIYVDLLIPGKMPVGVDQSYYDYIKNLIIKYNLQEQVSFIGWRENLIADIVQCDAVVLPSHTEGFPRSVIEAMLHKVPVISTPVGGIPEAIRHGETGMLFEVDNIEQLVKNLESIITDTNLRQNIIDKAFKYSQVYFHPEKNTKGVISVLKRL